MALIYIVEDDENIREIETIALKNSEHVVLSFANAADFFKKVELLLPELVLLDVMLPDMDGYEIVKKLRSNPATRKVPVIMVTAKTSEVDMLKGLDEGADDYIKKPFSVMELIMRVKALLRRSGTDEETVLCVGDILLDNARRVVLVDGESLELTFKEFQLLRYLMSNPGMVLSRDQITRFVWEESIMVESRTVDMHIKSLRKKLGASGSMIQTVRNVGYVMEHEKGSRA